MYMNNSEIKYDVESGYVYALEFGDKIKIGKSKNVEERIKQLGRTAKYAGVKIGNYIKSPKCYNYSYMETYIHDLFEDYRIDGTELFCEFSLSNVQTLFNNCDWQIDKPMQIVKKEEEFNAFYSEVTAPINDALKKCNSSIDIETERFLKAHKSQVFVSTPKGERYVQCRYFIETNDGNKFFADYVITSEDSILLHSPYYNYLYLDKKQIFYILDRKTNVGYTSDDFFNNIKDSCEKSDIECNDATHNEMKNFFSTIFDKVLTEEGYPVVSGQYYNSVDG